MKIIEIHARTMKIKKNLRDPYENHENHRKPLEINLRIKKIMKILEIHVKIMKIIKIWEIHTRIMKIKKII